MWGLLKDSKFFLIMTLDESPENQYNIFNLTFDTELKKKCLKSLLENGLYGQNQIIPSSIAKFLILKCDDEDFSFISQHFWIPKLSFSKDSPIIPVESRRFIISSHLKSLRLADCNLPCKSLDEFDLACAQFESCKIETLIVENVYLRTYNKGLMSNLGRIMERVVYLKFGLVQANDSVLQSDEIFMTFARDHLSKNKVLSWVDLRASNIDIMASTSRRNISINFAAEMRRWARRLKGLAFETDTSDIIRVLRIINRQCPLLKTACINIDDSNSKSSSVAELFDNLRGCLDLNAYNQGLSANGVLEPMYKLRKLCLSGHFKLFDHHLISILVATRELKYLNIS